MDGWGPKESNGYFTGLDNAKSQLLRRKKSSWANFKCSLLIFGLESDFKVSFLIVEGDKYLGDFLDDLFYQILRCRHDKATICKYEVILCF